MINFFFNVQRHYFVLDNNVGGMNTQKLIIYVPYSDYLRVYAYKDSTTSFKANYNPSNEYYSLLFDQTSKGEFTFEIFNYGIELATIDGRVYVVNKLEAFLLLKKSRLAFF